MNEAAGTTAFDVTGAFNGTYASAAILGVAGPQPPVFGGFEIDLRNAAIEGDSAVLEVNAVFGGVEVKIPRNWSAVVQGTGIFGGYTDTTVQPDERAPGFKRIFFRGGAVFGGVEVKN